MGRSKAMYRGNLNKIKIVDLFLFISLFFIFKSVIKAELFSFKAEVWLSLQMVAIRASFKLTKTVVSQS